MKKYYTITYTEKSSLNSDISFWLFEEPISATLLYRIVFDYEGKKINPYPINFPITCQLDDHIKRWLLPFPLDSKDNERWIKIIKQYSTKKFHNELFLYQL
ncbi:MAG: hypothetical protein ACFFKA_00700 [Candidatus Thorarchaeota archaeon]